jgi:hypothetical protein
MADLIKCKKKESFILKKEYFSVTLFGTKLARRQYLSQRNGVSLVS